MQINEFKPKPAYTVPQLVTTTGLGAKPFWYQAIRQGRLKARHLAPRKTIVLHEDLMNFLQTLPAVK